MTRGKSQRLGTIGFDHIFAPLVFPGSVRKTTTDRSERTRSPVPGKDRIDATTGGRRTFPLGAPVELRRNDF